MRQTATSMSEPSARIQHSHEPGQWSALRFVAERDLYPDARETSLERSFLYRQQPGSERLSKRACCTGGQGTVP